MVFPIPRPWTKVAHPVSGILTSEEASMEPAIELTLLWLPTSASALRKDLGDAGKWPLWL